MYVLKLSLGDFDFDFLFFFTTFLGSAAAAGAATATAAAATSFLARAVFLVEVGMIVLLFGWLRRTLSWSNVQVTTELCELWHSDILWCTWICVVGVGGESIAASIGSLLTHIGSWIWYLCLCCCTSSCRVKLHGDTSKFHGAPNKRMARLRTS